MKEDHGVRPIRRTFMSGEDPLAAAIERLAEEMAELKDVVTTPVVPPETAPPGTTAIPNGFIIALVLMLITYAIGLPAYMRGYHDVNTPPPEVIQRDNEHDRRLDDHNERLRTLERGNTP